MPDYKLGKIYAIRSHQTDQIYIGSTTETLCRRFDKHKSYIKENRYCSSCEILKYPDAYIELIELFPCSSKEELNKKEGEHIRANNCVNKYRPSVSKEEQKKEASEWWKNHPEKTKEYNDKKKEYYKQYRQAHKNKIAEKQSS